jgi:hypothetical protein
MKNKPSVFRDVAAFRGYSTAVILLGAVLAGCTSTTLPEAAALGAVGKSAATTMQQAAVVPSADIQHLMTSDAFMVSYIGPDAKADVTRRHDLITKVQEELALRAAVLDNLGKTYAAFASLASYNASGNFNTALTSLTTSVNAYLKGANQPPIPADANSLIPTGGGLLVGMVQTQAVRNASGQIVPLLNQTIAAMQSHQSDFTGFKEIVESQSGDAAAVLYGAGLFSITPLLNQIGTPSGYTARPDADRILDQPGKESLRRALVAAQATLTQDQLKLVNAAYDQSLAVLKKLPEQHALLENGKPMDLSQVMDDLTALQKTVAQIATALALK